MAVFTVPHKRAADAMATCLSKKQFASICAQREVLAFFERASADDRQRIAWLFCVCLPQDAAQLAQEQFPSLYLYTNRVIQKALRLFTVRALSAEDRARAIRFHRSAAHKGIVLKPGISAMGAAAQRTKEGPNCMDRYRVGRAWTSEESAYLRSSVLAILREQLQVMWVAIVGKMQSQFPEAREPFTVLTCRRKWSNMNRKSKR